MVYCLKNLTIRLLFLLCSLTSTVARASTDESLGLGIVIGNPTGLTGKLRRGPEQAIDFGLAFSLNNYALIYGDYLFMFPDIFRRSSTGLFIPYLGAGAIIAFANSGVNSYFFASNVNAPIGLGLRVPFGIEWIPNQPSIGLFAELAPGIAVLPATVGLLMGGVGLRYYF